MSDSTRPPEAFHGTASLPALLRRWSWLLAAGTLLVSLAAFVYAKRQTPLYEARATILVNQAQALTGPSYSDVLANQQLCKTYAQIVPSGPVLRAVGQATGVTPGHLAQQVTSTCRRETQLIDIDVRDPDPALAARIANETAAAFADRIRQAQLGQQSNAESDLEKQVAALQSSIDEKQGFIAQLGAAQADANNDQRRNQLAQAQIELDALRQNLSSLQRRLQDLRIDLARSINSVTLADPAAPPPQPVTPRVGLSTLIGAVLGLLAAGAIAAAFEYLDDTVKSPDDVTRAVGASTLGAIVRMRPPAGNEGRRAAPRLLSGYEGNSTVAEAYRMVRTNLEFARGGRHGRTMLITSALPGEGKSTTTANLALVLAQTGRSVLLVDADLRRPTQHRLFDVPNSAGLSTLFVMDEPEVEGLVRFTQEENLRVLPSGPLPPNPAELLSSDTMRQIIALLQDQADIVLFDSPPLLGVADASALSAQLDGVVLVVDSDRTRAAALIQAVEVLGRAQATLWGVVLNKLKSRGGDGYYYYYAQQYGRDQGDPPARGSYPGSRQPNVTKPRRGMLGLRAALKRRTP